MRTNVHHTGALELCVWSSPSQRDEWVDTVTALVRLGTAVAIGLMLGLEREHSTAGDPVRPAGSRTFPVLALCGAVAAILSPVVVAVGLAGTAALVVTWYWHEVHETRRPDVGATTEAAALVTYLLGALSWSHPQLAVPAGVAMATLLAAKQPLHRFATRLVSDRDIRDALTLFVVAFVILPILPNRPLGPYGALNPRRVWLLVIAVTLIGWAGYVAARAVGKRVGLLVSGLAGGFVSASATTAVLARQARQGGSVVVLPAVLATNVATLALLVAVTTVANPAMAARVAIGAGGGVLVLGGEIGWLLWRGRHRPADRTQAQDESGEDHLAAQRPMSLWAALGLAALLVTMLVLTKAAAAVLGGGGVVAAAAVGGLADAHASSLAAVTLVGHSIGAGVGLAAVGAALATNTVVKLVLAAIAGGPRFAGRLVLWLLVPAVAVAVGMVLAATAW
jgi:uncharacterized membrane protein (DUF4010 family)